MLRQLPINQTNQRKLQERAGLIGGMQRGKGLMCFKMLSASTRIIGKLSLGFVVFIVGLGFSNAANLHDSLVEDREFLVAAVFQVPLMMFFVKGPGGNITSKSGILVDVLDWVAEHAKFKLQYSIIETYEFGSAGGLPIAGARLFSGEVDICVTFSPTEDRIDRMDFSYPISCDPLYLLLPFPDEESRLATIFTFLSPSAALASLLSIVAVASVLGIYYWMHRPSNSSRHSVSDTVWASLMYSITSFTGGSGLGYSFIMPYNVRLSFRLGIGVAMLMVVILTTVFSGVLTSRMTALKYKPIVNSFDDLVDHPDYNLIQPVNSDLGSFIYNSTTGIWKKLRDLKRRLPFEIIYANFTTSVHALLLEYNGVSAMTKAETRWYIGDDIKKHPGKCRFTRSKPLGNFITASSISTRKGFKYSHTISNSLQHLAGYGLVDHWTETYFPNIDKCIITDSSSLVEEAREAAPLQVSHFLGAFLLLGSGLSIAIFVWLCECIVGLRNRRKNDLNERYHPIVRGQLEAIIVGGD